MQLAVCWTARRDLVRADHGLGLKEILTVLIQNDNLNKKLRY